MFALNESRSYIDFRYIKLIDPEFLKATDGSDNIDDGV